MDKAATIVSAMLQRLAAECKVGMTGKQLTEMAEAMLTEYGATSFNKDYKPSWAKVPYPAALCVSPNGIIIHGIPNEYAFREGDIVTLDLGIVVDGLCGDAALTVPIGEISNANARLLRHARKAVYAYIDELKPGVNTRDLAAHMTRWATQRGFNVNRRGAGHTIGVQMHMKPTMYNTVEDDVHTYGEVKAGMVVCIEPILTQSKDTIGALLSDGWSVATMDGKNCAMFEHMVRITETGAEVLTTHFDTENDFIPYKKSDEKTDNR